MGLQSKVIVYVAIAGLLAMMGGFVLYASLDNPQLEQVEVDLVGVEVISVDRISGTLKVQTTFLVSNPSEKTFTVPAITYDVFADDTRITSGQYSTEDIAMPGRAAFYPEAKIPLKSNTSVSKEDLSARLYDLLVAGEFGNFSAEGTITVESAWSIIEKEFRTSM